MLITRFDDICTCNVKKKFASQPKHILARNGYSITFATMVLIRKLKWQDMFNVHLPIKRKVEKTNESQ